MRRMFVFLICISLLLPININAMVDGSAAILIDGNSGRVLYEKDVHEQKLIASTVKVMTALLAIESGRLYDLVKIDDNVLKSYGSGIYVSLNEEILLIDLVYGLMLRSGNDAALAIANFVAGNETRFVELMNRKAIELGLENTRFMNPHGLDEKNSNMVSAYDLAIIYKEAMNNEIFREIASTNNYTTKTNLKTYVWTNKNKLLRTYKYTTGGKTGFTKKSGRTLVSSAKKDNLELIVVTLNNGNDFSDHKKLYEYGFNKYSAVTLINSNRFKMPNSKYYGDRLYIREEFIYPLTKKEQNLIRKEIKLKKPRDEPGPKVGKINIYKSNELIGSVDVYVKSITRKPKPKKSFLWRLFK